MKIMDIDILGWYEICWLDDGDFWSENTRILYISTIVFIYILKMDKKVLELYSIRSLVRELRTLGRIATDYALS